MENRFVFILCVGTPRKYLRFGIHHVSHLRRNTESSPIDAIWASERTKSSMIEWDDVYLPPPTTSRAFRRVKRARNREMTKEAFSHSFYTESESINNTNNWKWYFCILPTNKWPTITVNRKENRTMEKLDNNFNLELHWLLIKSYWDYFRGLDPGIDQSLTQSGPPNSRNLFGRWIRKTV